MASNDADMNQLGNDDGVSAVATRGVPTPVSNAQWEELKDLLVDLFENRDWTVKEINGWMRGMGRQTTQRMISNRLKAWGCGKYQSAKEKENICSKLLEDHGVGRPPQRLDIRQIKRLQRHCREKQEPTDQDKIVLDILQNMETAVGEPDYDEIDVEEEEDEDEDTQVGDHSTVDTTIPRNMVSRMETSQEAVGENEANFSGTPTNAIQRSSEHSACSALIRQPPHGSRSIEKLFRLSQEYYLSKLQEHPLGRLQDSDNVDLPGGTLPAGFGTNNYVIGLSVNREFWRHVKNGFYWLKTGSTSAHLAETELRDAFAMIPVLCERVPPFPVLKDMYATLAPVATGINLRLRTELLRAFGFHSRAKLGPHDTFAEICRIFYAEAGAEAGGGVMDDMAVAALRSMLDATRTVLQPMHPDLIELQRTLVRLHRRKGDMSAAEALCSELIHSAERVERELDPRHIHVRNALSEYVYILNDQRRYEEALVKARDVLVRAQAGLGAAFPDERSIYAMEDVAEICDRLGRITEGISFLRKALREAIGLWGNQRSTMHILDKLEVMEDKRYQLGQARVL